MEWVPPIVEIVLQVLIELGPVIESACHTSTPRAHARSAIESDNWKCPGPAEFGTLMRGQDARTNEALRLDLTSSSPELTHPLWDRELDN
jgi:hypothetical protein